MWWQDTSTEGVEPHTDLMLSVLSKPLSRGHSDHAPKVDRPLCGATAPSPGSGQSCEIPETSLFIGRLNRESLGLGASDEAFHYEQCIRLQHATGAVPSSNCENSLPMANWWEKF